MRLRNVGNGAIINVDDELGESMLGGAWKLADEVSIPEGEPEISWKADQLVAYAKLHEIDLGKATKKDDVLAVITTAQHGG